MVIIESHDISQLLSRCCIIVERSSVTQQITVSSDEEVFSSPTKASPLRTSSSPVKASPSPGHTASGASPRSAASVSPATSLKSLSNLDDEAQLSGLQLRQVREAEIQKAHGINMINILVKTLNKLYAFHIHVYVLR